MATQYEKNVGNYQKEIAKVGRKYNTKPLSDSLCKIIGDSLDAHKLDKNEFQEALTSPQKTRQYLRGNSAYFKLMIAEAAKIGKVAYKEISNLYKEIDDLNEDIDDLEGKEKNCKKNHKNIRKYEKKADLLDRIRKASRDFKPTPSTRPNQVDIDYLRRL